MATRINQSNDARRGAASHNLPAPLADRWLTEKELAAKWRIPVKTLQAWRYRGGGPPFSKFGSLVRYNETKADDWAEERSKNSTSDPGPGGR